MIHKRARQALMAAATMVAISSCGSVESVSIGADFDLGEGEHTVCVPASKVSGDATMFGDVWLRHQGDRPVTITEVTLVEPKDMTLRETLLVAVKSGEDLVGMRHTSNDAPLPAGWEDRVEAEGALIQPGEEWNLVPIVEGGSTDIASAKATRIIYEAPDGTAYRQDTITSMLITSVTCDEALAGWSAR